MAVSRRSGTTDGMVWSTWRAPEVPKPRPRPGSETAREGLVANIGRRKRARSSEKVVQRGQVTHRGSKSEVQAKVPGENGNSNGKFCDFWIVPGSKIIEKPLVL